MQRHTELAPDLGARVLGLQHALVELDRLRRLAHEQVHLGHRLEHERAVFTALQRELVLAKRFGVVALLPEGEAEVEVRELLVVAHLESHRALLLPLGHELLEARAVVAVEREVGLRPRQRRIELDGATGGDARLLVPPRVAQHEAHQIVGVRVVGVELDRALERYQRFLVEPPVVEHFAHVEMDERALGLELPRALEPALRAVEVAARLLGQAELHDGGDVLRVVLEQLGELEHRLAAVAQRGVRAPELPARVAIGGVESQPVLQHRDAPLVVARVEVRDLEIALRHLHLRIELERAREGVDRLLVESLVVVEDAEVVVRPRVRRIDPPGERAQDLPIALGGEGRLHDHAQPTRTARRMAWSESRSGSRRKKPRSTSPSSLR